MFETSYSLCQTAAGPRSEVVDGGAPGGFVGGEEIGAALCWLMRSQRSTMLSSPPDARMPRRLGDHSTQLSAAEWPFNSSRAWPGWRTSRTRTTLESWENVAKRWASCGDAEFGVNEKFVSPRWIHSYLQFSIKAEGTDRSAIGLGGWSFRDSLLQILLVLVLNVYLAHAHSSHSCQLARR